MQSHSTQPYNTESGTINVMSDTFNVPEYNIEHKYIKKFTVPIQSMLFLIRASSRFHYMFVGKEVVMFSTDNEITQFSYDNLVHLRYKGYYALTDNSYILLPENRTIRRNSIY